MSKVLKILFILLLVAISIIGYSFYEKFFLRVQVLEQIVERLQADSRIAEIVVTDTGFNATESKQYTTIKFLEYDVSGKALKPKYYTFSGNVLQFQSLVIRFEDSYVEEGDALRGRSICLFWKVFRLDGDSTEEYDITTANEVPKGYTIGDARYANLEGQFWERFWSYALDTENAKSKGIKNVQIEAPGTKFVPGLLYTIKIEHDGGLRIDSRKIPEVLKGETVQP